MSLDDNVDAYAFQNAAADKTLVRPYKRTA